VEEAPGGDKLPPWRPEGKRAGAQRGGRERGRCVECARGAMSSMNDAAINAKEDAAKEAREAAPLAREPGQPQRAANGVRAEAAGVTAGPSRRGGGETPRILGGLSEAPRRAGTPSVPSCRGVCLLHSTRGSWVLRRGAAGTGASRAPPESRLGGFRIVDPKQ